MACCDDDDVKKLLVVQLPLIKEQINFINLCHQYLQIQLIAFYFCLTLLEILLS